MSANDREKLLAKYLCCAVKAVVVKRVNLRTCAKNFMPEPAEFRAYRALARKILQAERDAHRAALDIVLAEESGEE